MARYKDWTGYKFSKLTVLHLSEKQDRPHKYWDCLCECGVIVSIASNDIKKGYIKSCGCFRKEKRRTHSKHHTQIYNTWRGMKERCLSQTSYNFSNYGGRGIKVCPEWLDAKLFIDWAEKNGYKPGLTIERVDNDGDYTPENCKFIPLAEQAKNTRNCVFVEHNGETLCREDFLRKYSKVHRDTVRYRQKHFGLTLKEAALLPPRRGPNAH